MGKLPKTHNLLKSNQGFTLVESLVSVFILGLISFVLAASMNTANSQLKNIQAKSTKLDLSSVMRFHTSDYLSLYNSSQMPENLALKNCMQGTSDTACTNNQDIEFNYYGAIRNVPVYDSGGNVVSNKAPMIGGISGLKCPGNSGAPSPAFYTLDGQLCACTDAAGRCPIQLITKYSAFCSVGTSCKYPTGFRVTYHAQLRPEVPTNILFSNLNGSFFIPITDNTNYLKFVYAGSYFIDSAGVESLRFSTGDYDIRQGAVIQFIPPSIIRMNVALSSPVPITTVELFKYTYPMGCNSTNLGTTLTNGTSCMPPLDDQYTFDKVLSGTELNSGIFSAEATIASTVVVEYKVKSFDASHNLVAVTRSPLRVSYSLEGALSVKPPIDGLYFICDPANVTTNAFAFKATETIGGWKSLTATISPALPDGSTELPGFSGKFNPSLTTEQNIVIDVTKFPDTGGTYTVTFQGTTNGNETKTVSANFKVNPVPANTAVIISPLSTLKIRASSDLNFRARVKLSCNETVKSANLSLTHGGTTLFGPQDIASTCTKESSGTPDQASYLCTKVYPCMDWLNLTEASQCPNKFPSTTTVTAKLDVIDSSSQTINADPVSFSVSPKLSIWLAEGYSQFLNVNYSGNTTITPPAMTKIKIQLSSTLLPYETISFNYGPKSYTCRQSGGGSATYGDFGSGYIYASIIGNGSMYFMGYGCVLNISTPNTATPAAPVVYQLSSTDPNVEVLNPNSTKFKALDSSILSCNASDSGAPTCAAGKTLQTKITSIGYSYDNDDWSFMHTSANFSLEDPIGSTLDFFLYYRPTSSSKDPKPVLSLNFMILNSKDQIVSTATFDTLISKCSQASPLSCEGDYTRINADFFNSKRVWYTHGAGMSATAFPPSPPSTDAIYEFMLMRECYCK